MCLRVRSCLARADGAGADDEGSPAVDLAALRASEAGRNLFVQNLPFQASKSDVVDAFKVGRRRELFWMRF